MPSMLSKLVGAVGEYGDAVNAIYDALPWQMTSWKGRDGKWRSHHVGPWEKSKFIYENLDKVNIDKAVSNLVANQVEDYLYGRLGKSLGQAVASNPYYQSPVGVQTGLAH